MKNHFSSASTSKFRSLKTFCVLILDIDGCFHDIDINAANKDDALELANLLAEQNGLDVYNIKVIGSYDEL